MFYFLFSILISVGAVTLFWMPLHLEFDSISQRLPITLANRLTANKDLLFFSVALFSVVAMLLNTDLNPM